MLIVTIIYPIKDKERKIKIFNPNFVKKNKKYCKFIYKNKILPLQTELIANDKNIDKIKIKLVCFCKNIEILNLINGCESFNKLYKYEKDKNGNDNIKIPFYNSSLMLYANSPNEGKIKIFGEEFIKNNKNKCIIIYKNKIYPLKEYFYLSDTEKEKFLEILIIEIDNISDKSYMFHNCDLLIAFLLIENNFDNLDNSNTNNINEILKKDKNNSNSLNEQKSSNEKNPFLNLYAHNSQTMNIYSSSLSEYIKKKSSLNDIIKMISLLKNISSLKSLKDITKWDMYNITNMSYMFSGCSILISLPDISKWNISNVTNMSYLFNECCSLVSLPDISNWNTNNVIDMSYLFSECKSLKSLPDISKWDTNKVKNMNGIFENCIDLINIPEISKWNISNLEEINKMFNG